VEQAHLRRSASAPGILALELKAQRDTPGGQRLVGDDVVSLESAPASGMATCAVIEWLTFENRGALPSGSRTMPG
jgi:hypothetical protein